jgi:hypothetical protein
VPARIVSFEREGLIVSRRRGRFTIAYGEILTAERLRAPRRALRLHTRTADPVTLSCRRNRVEVEDELRQRGVRIVDCWGAILAPSLPDFERELIVGPENLRQSYDDAGG